MQILSRLYLFLCRWKLRGTVPENKDVIMVSYPHTSIWDVFSIYAILAKHGKGIKMAGIARKGMPARMGACMNMQIIEVDVKKHTNRLSQIVQKYQGGWLALAPGGTRSFRPYVRTGFYHMAKGCNVPIVFANANFRNHTVSFSAPLDVSHLTKEETIQHMFEYYSSQNLMHSGKYGTNANIIKMKT